MTKLKRWKFALALLAFCALGAAVSVAQTFQTLVNFDGGNGAGPLYMSLNQGPDGDFYGTTYTGSVFQGGVLFKITPRGTLMDLHNFCSLSNCEDGWEPRSGLVLATDGASYGTTGGGGLNQECLGGCGTIYRTLPNGKFTTVFNFSPTDGYNSWGPLLQAADGNFYGTTDDGGANGWGTIFKISTRGALTVLYSFRVGAGAGPGEGPLTQGWDGDLYGIAGGGSHNYGMFFKISPKGKLTVLYSFCSQPNCADGRGPSGGLLLGADGNFYGTTLLGGAGTYCGENYQGGCGTVFKISPDGALTTLYSFCEQKNCADGANPWAGLIQATDGDLYGTTSAGGEVGDVLSCPVLYVGCGTVFKITETGAVTTLHKFIGLDGWMPTGGLVQATTGDFYGTTEWGGNAGNGGTVYNLNMGLGPFVAFVQGGGRVGGTAQILGQGFEGTTEVSFNGTPANYTVRADTFMTARVPPGATTGFVTVTTPSGVLKSNVPFRVIP